MKKKVALPLALILLLGVSVVASAHTVHVFRWQHFGAAPYATSHTQAMKMRESAFVRLGLPHQVVLLLMEKTKKHGKEVRLVNGDHLTAMLSRGGIVHRRVLVDFTTPPVNGKMEYAAPAEQWQVSWRGKTYTVILPKVCNNWSVRVTTASQCATVTFRIKHIGTQVRYAVFTQGKRLPSTCWSLSDGGVVSAAPSPCTVCNWVGVIHNLPFGFVPEYTGLYTVHSHLQVLRFPREVAKNYVVLCVTRKGLGESDSWIVPPSAWVARAWDTIGASAVIVPYGNQKWPVWGTEAITWSKL